MELLDQTWQRRWAWEDGTHGPDMAMQEAWEDGTHGPGNLALEAGVGKVVNPKDPAAGVPSIKIHVMGSHVQGTQGRIRAREESQGGAKITMDMMTTGQTGEVAGEVMSGVAAM